MPTTPSRAGRHRAGRAAAAGVVVLTVLTGCSRTEPAPRAVPPPAGARFDYQLAGAYPPAEGVAVVSRDRTERPAGLGYDVCYVNGFQTQPSGSAAFAAEHPELVVQTDDGPLADPRWPDELLFDTSTAPKRAELLELVAPWVRGCAEDGYDAVEVDDLDSWTRSQGHLTADDNAALAVGYARVVHEAGLAVAQKNAPEASEQLRAAGYDFAVAESCAVHDECSAYTDHYPVVLDVEYTDELGPDGFAALCADGAGRTGGGGGGLARVLRDHDLLTPDDEGYAYAACPA